MEVTEEATAAKLLGLGNDHKVCFEFDDKLKALLDRVPENIGKKFSSPDMLERKKGADKLREFLRDNWRSLTMNHRRRGFINPDYLFFALAYCSDYHKYNSLDELNEALSHPYWRNHVKPRFMMGGGTVSVWNINGNEHSVGTLCACGKSINDIWDYENPETKKGFPIGNHCIQLGFILAEQEIEKIKKAFDVKCETCGKKLGTHRKIQTTDCPRCEKKFRRCVTCKQYKVYKNEPYWKRKCLRCWHFAKN